MSTTQIARLLELFCLERDIPLYGYGRTTFRKEEAARGLEPDECYSARSRSRVAAIGDRGGGQQPLLDKLKVYAGLGIREVWVFYVKDQVFSVYTLKGDAHERVALSEVLPEVTLDRLAHHAVLPEPNCATVLFRNRHALFRPVVAPRGSGKSWSNAWP